MTKKEIRFRCWIDIDGEKFFGPGPAQLLSHIEETGSLSQAAKAMGMSYRKAWNIVNRLNTQGTQPLVTLQKGGQKGGGAELTNRGKKVVTRYNKLINRIDTLIVKDKSLLKLI